MQLVRTQLQFASCGLTGRGVRVGIIDTGVDPDHPDLSKALERGASYSFLPVDRTPIDKHLHGTHIAGIIAGSGVASRGRFRGLAPDVALFTYKVSNNTTLRETAIAHAISQAIADRVDILNYSAGYSPFSKVGPAPWVWAKDSLIEELFREAAGEGILCVVAAGNDGLFEGRKQPSSLNRPAGMPEVLTVGAATLDGRVWGSSSRGPYLVSSEIRRGGVDRRGPHLEDRLEKSCKPDLIAPGEGIFATKSKYAPEYEDEIAGLGGDYVRISGTSQATAVVSGVAACTLELLRREKIPLGSNPQATLKGVLAIATTRPRVGDRYDFGKGLISWPAVVTAVEGCKQSGDVLDIAQHGGGNIEAI